MLGLNLRKRIHAARHPDARTVVVQTGGSKQIAPHIAAGSALFRRPTDFCAVNQPTTRGMWVVYHGHPGVLVGLEPGDIATVMLTDFEKGENLQEIHCPAAELRQAWLEEIPVARRPHVERATAFGYHPKPV